jgi:Peptidase M15
MSKRIATAAVGILLALQVTSAHASPYYGYDGRHYGEIKASPDFGRSEAQTRHHAKGGGSRAHLTPAILAVLDQIESKFGPVDVISGYRPGARIATTGRISRHASGNAIDIDAGSRKGAIVKWLIANHHNGGTMTYSDMSHIHVDIGPHFVALGANSGHGGRRVARGRYRDNARYAAAGYSRRYYAGERRSRSRYSYERPYHGRRFASGYATIYQ